MTITLSPWWWWALLSLALFGVVFWWRVARQAGRDVADWWRGRRQPLGDEEQVCTGCLCSVWSDEASSWPEDVQAIWEQERLCWQCQNRLAPLPPERSWKELTGEQPAIDTRPPTMLQPFTFNDDLHPARERRAPWYEAEYRHHYAAMELDYPSGLLARVRGAGQ